jgi:hypothetical protein
MLADIFPFFNVMQSIKLTLVLVPNIFFTVLAVPYSKISV